MLTRLNRFKSSHTPFFVAPVFVLLLGFGIFTASNPVLPASAHISKVFGDVTVEVGWNNEPALTGQMNAAQLTIFTGSADKPQPVLNAVANLEITAQYGTITKKLDFIPSGSVDGQYLASIIPTREGTYTLHIKGTVKDQSIDTQINLDDVASSDTLNFPPTSAGSTGDNGNISPDIASQLGGIISQLTGDVDSAKKSADTAAQNSASAQQSASDAKNSADRSFLIGLTAIGVGAAGIAIAVTALNRRESKLVQR